MALWRPRGQTWLAQTHSQETAKPTETGLPILSWGPSLLSFSASYSFIIVMARSSITDSGRTGGSPRLLGRTSCQNDHGRVSEDTFQSLIQYICIYSLLCSSDWPCLGWSRQKWRGRGASGIFHNLINFLDNDWGEVSWPSPFNEICWHPASVTTEIIFILS